MKDCSDHESCRRIWTKIRNNREEELRMLLDELKAVAERGGLSPEEKQSAA
jgi:hypothetical protein